MSPKVFFTGITGFIGGDAFAELHDAHPDWDYVLLVRSDDRARLVKERYPSLTTVVGTLDDASVLEEQAAAADIVIHTADSADHLASAQSIIKGLAAGHSPARPGRYLHLSGTGILQWYDMANKRYGEPPAPGQVYNDVSNIDRLVSLPDDAPHRNVDKIVIAANDIPSVKTAIVCPPLIYGTGRGPGNTRSAQVNYLARFALRNGYSASIGRNLHQWDNIHVRDLSRLWVLLAEAATDAASKRDDPEIFGPRAYFLADNGRRHLWRDVTGHIARAARDQGFMKEARIETTDVDTVGNVFVACNSQGVAERAGRFLGWRPREGSLEEDIPNTVAVEAKVLGIEPTFAVK